MSDASKYLCPDCGLNHPTMMACPKLSVPAAGSVTLELLYNGDYPGHPCVRINGRWITTEQEDMLCALFGLDVFGYSGLRKLYDKVGAKKINGSVEHMPWEGILTLTVSQNDQALPRGGAQETHE